MSELLHKGLGTKLSAWGLRLTISKALDSWEPYTLNTGANLTFLSIPKFCEAHHSTAALSCDHLAAGPSNLYSTTNQSGVLQRIMGFLTNW